RRRGRRPAPASPTHWRAGARRRYARRASEPRSAGCRSSRGLRLPPAPRSPSELLRVELGPQLVQLVAARIPDELLRDHRGEPPHSRVVEDAAEIELEAEAVLDER